MISHLSIQNFRSHKDVELHHCGRINILLGKNNAGKTAILEAILLLCFPPNPRDVLNLLNEQRGYKPGDENSELWDSYFNQWNHAQPILLKIQQSVLSTRLNVCQTLSIDPIIGFANQVISGSVIEGRDMMEKTNGLVFKYRYEDKTIERKVASLSRKSKQILEERARYIVERMSPIAFIPSKGIASPQDEAERFSRLEKANRHHEVEEALRMVEPRLKRLTVIASEQGSMVYGDLGEEHLIPVPLMGEGMVRMLAIAGTMANNQGGIVLIDEVENGLHYSVLPALWEMIFQTAVRLNIQVFVATHSDECLRAVSQIAQTKSYADELRLFRLDLRNGRTVVTEL
ncbi:MAG: ATP/GTP-binding protein [Bacteroidales bacterium]